VIVQELADDTSGRSYRVGVDNSRGLQFEVWEQHHINMEGGMVEVGVVAVVAW
jgi:hypothetical protein